MALGVGFSIKADLGTSPISSLPYTVSLVAPAVSVGTATIIMHCVFIFIQLLLLRKDFGISQLLQLPVALIFGWMTDLAVLLLGGVSGGSYIGQWLLCLIGVVLVALGVSAEVLAGVVTLAGEGLVLALCKVLPVKFGGMKVGFDLTLVISSIVLGLFWPRAKCWASERGPWRPPCWWACCPGRYAGPWPDMWPWERKNPEKLSKTPLKRQAILHKSWMVRNNQQ